MEALVASSPGNGASCFPPTFCAATSKAITFFSVENSSADRRYTASHTKGPHSYSPFSHHHRSQMDPGPPKSDGVGRMEASEEWPARCSVLCSGALTPAFVSSSSSSLLAALAMNEHLNAIVTNTSGSVAVATVAQPSTVESSSDSHHHHYHRHRAPHHGPPRSDFISCVDLFLPYLPDKSFVGTAAWSPLSSSVVLLGGTNGRVTLFDTEVQYCPGHGSSSSSHSQPLSEWNFSGRITTVRYVPHTNTAVVSYVQPNPMRYGLLLCDPRLSDSSTAISFGSDEPDGGDEGGVDYEIDRLGGTPSSSGSSKQVIMQQRKKKKRAAVTSFFLGLCPLPYAEVVSCHLNQCSVATAGGSGSGVEILQLWDVRNARQPIHQVRSRRDEFQHIEWKPSASSLALLTMMKNGSMKIFDFSSMCSSSGCEGMSTPVPGETAGTAAVTTAANSSLPKNSHMTLPQEVLDYMDASTTSSGMTSVISSHLSVGACLPVHVKPPRLQCVTWLQEPSDAILAVDSAGSVRVVPARLGMTVTWGPNQQPLVALGHTVAETAVAGQGRSFATPETAIAFTAPHTPTSPPLAQASVSKVQSADADIEEIMMRRLQSGFSADLSDALIAATRTKEESLVCLIRYLRLMVTKYATAFHCSRTSGILHILRLPGAVDETTGEVSSTVRELILTAVGWPHSATFINDMTETSRDHVEKTAAIRIFTGYWDDAAQWLSLYHRVNEVYGVLAPLLQCAVAVDKDQRRKASPVHLLQSTPTVGLGAPSSGGSPLVNPPLGTSVASYITSPELADQLRIGLGVWLQPAISYVMRSASEENIVANAMIPFCDKIGLAAAILTNHADLVAALELLLAEKECSFERCLLLGFGEDGLTEMQRYVDVSGDFQLSACVFAPFTAKNHPFLQTWNDEYRKFLSSKGLFFHRARYDLAVKKYLLAASHTHHERNRPHCEVRCICGIPMHDRQQPSGTTGGLRPAQAGVCKTMDCKPMCVVCARRVEGPLVETLPAMWYAWCTTCLHGGHYHHLVEWFAKHKQCPVECCTCECCEHATPR
jgi:hypothetical protein